ncbi:MAG: hypothetical protein LBQ76_08610 [Candidatus Fibromonas sp.]|nr:hypothetical protein [Candidatus Fibromonas sp.]
MKKFVSRGTALENEKMNEKLFAKLLKANLRAAFKSEYLTSSRRMNLYRASI